MSAEAQNRRLHAAVRRCLCRVNQPQKGASHACWAPRRCRSRAAQLQKVSCPVADAGQLSARLRVQLFVNGLPSLGVVFLGCSYRKSRSDGSETQRDILYGSAAKPTEAHRRVDRQDRSKPKRTEADESPNTALWTTVSGFASLPPSQHRSLPLARWQLGQVLGFDRLAALTALGTHPCLPANINTASLMIYGA